MSETGARSPGLLFLCVANSARSQMGEGIARHLAGDRIFVQSAGSHPSHVHPLAIRVLDELGIDASGQRSKSVLEIDPATIDTVITLCAEEECPLFLGEAERLHWEQSDPAAGGTGTASAAAPDEMLAGFRAIRDTLMDRLYNWMLERGFLSPLPRVGVSECLLGREVRYDGGHNRIDFLVDELGEYVEWVPICPEVEIGLTTPRKPIDLYERDNEIRFVTTETGEDLTEKITSYSRSRLHSLGREPLCGYVFKSGSPSCGPRRIPIYSAIGRRSGWGRGLFADAFARSHPTLPLVDERELADPRVRENFVARVFAHRRWIARGQLPGSLAEFHTRHAFRLMAHSQAGTMRLERVLRDPGRFSSEEEQADVYAEEFAHVTSRVPTRNSQTRTLRKIHDVLADHLEPTGRDQLIQSIERYQRGEHALNVPIEQVRRITESFSLAEIRDQTYLTPYPAALRLLEQI